MQNAPLAIVILILSISSLVASPPAADPLPKFPPEQLVEDFRILRTALEEAHSGIYRYTPKEAMDGIFDRAEKSLNRPMDALEFYRIVAPVVAAVKCGHTGVQAPADLPAQPILPLNVRLIDGKAYVFRD